MHLEKVSKPRSPLDDIGFLCRPISAILQDFTLYEEVIDESVGQAITMTRFPGGVDSDWSFQRLKLFREFLLSEVSSMI